MRWKGSPVAKVGKHFKVPLGADWPRAFRHDMKPTRGAALADDPVYLRVSASGSLDDGSGETIREVFGRGLVNLDFEQLDDRPKFMIELRGMSGVTLLRGLNSPHVARTFDVGRLCDQLALSWAQRGRKGGISQRGYEAPAGTYAFFDCAEPVVGRADEPIRHANVRFARSMLMSLVPDAEDRLMKPIDATSPAARLLDAYIAAIDWPAKSTPELDHAMAVHLVDLVALVVGASGDAGRLAAQRGARAARLSAIKSWLLARLDWPDLSLPMVARANGLSGRSVQLLFKEVGTSYSSFVFDERMKQVHRRLSDRRFDHHSIASIAFGSGFGDLSHFNRDFRRRFGASPSDIRHGSAVDRDA